MKIIFRVFCPTLFGESVVVTGNVEELGLWNAHNYLSLTYVKHGWWEGYVVLKATKGIEYKYVKHSLDGVIWEVGKNRDLETLEEKEKEVGLTVDVFSQRRGSDVADGASQISLKVMTYNVRLDTTWDGQNSWIHRKENVSKLVQISAPDVVGLQEPFSHQVQDLESALRENYSWIGRGREADGSGEFAPIFYNHHVFYVMDSGTFWISERPEQPGSSSWNSACRRICTWAKLVTKANNSTIFVFNTHLDHRSALAREKGLELLFCKIQSMSYGFPAILVGDFNIDEEESLIQNATNSKELSVFPNYMANAKTKSITSPLGPKHTFTGWTDTELCSIDYILVKHDMVVYSYSVSEGKSEDGKHLSDHRPVCAEILV